MQGVGSGLGSETPQSERHDCQEESQISALTPGLPDRPCRNPSWGCHASILPLNLPSPALEVGIARAYHQQYCDAQKFRSQELD
jgi:hypothetical protein